MHVRKITIREEMFSQSRKRATMLVLFGALLSLLLHPGFPFLIIFAYIGYIRAIVHKKFLKAFAKKHGFTYAEKIPKDILKLYKARLFSHGRSQKGFNMLSKSHREHVIELFNFSCVVGSGKHKRTLNFTVANIDFPKTHFPHILLKSKKMGRYQQYNFWGHDKDVKISLEQPFNDAFDLYCTQDYEIEVLQIFSTELLQKLQSYKGAFSIEFGDNSAYIYRDTILYDEQDITELIDIIDSLLDHSGPLINRLHDDFEALHTVIE